MDQEEGPAPVLPNKHPQSKSNAKKISALKAEAKPEMDTSEDEEQRIIYQGESSLDHHLWLLMPATMVRDAGYNGSPMFQEVVHQHFFHNVTSNGDPKDVCSPVGGHFHKVTIIPSKKAGIMPKIQVGPAYQLVQKKFGNAFKTVEQEIKFFDNDGTVIADNHTHKTQYMGSQKLQVRKINTEAVKVSVTAEAPGKSIPGIAG